MGNGWLRHPVYTNEGNPGYPFTPVNNSWTTQANNRSNCDTNPLGYYRRTFTLPTDWNDKRVMVHFDGAYSAIAVYINGKYVGYSQGANTDAEFDITDFVSQTDENNITVACFRWSDGSYLEGQDMWHLSGIHRDVYLVATPKVFISDHYIHSSLNSNYTSGSMTVDITIDNRTKSSVEKNIKVELLDATGTSKGTQTITYSGSSNATRTVTFSNLSGLTPWSAENPYLYTVVVSQLDGTSEEMVFSTKYGFRKVEVVNNYSQRQVLVNGKRVFFKGVNTQDTHPLYGRAIDLETMMKDVKLMKQANVNTVRTSHYPASPRCTHSSTHTVSTAWTRPTLNATELTHKVSDFRQVQLGHPLTSTAPSAWCDATATTPAWCSTRSATSRAQAPTSAALTKSKGSDQQRRHRAL